MKVNCERQRGSTLPHWVGLWKGEIEGTVDVVVFEESWFQRGRNSPIRRRISGTLSGLVGGAAVTVGGDIL